MNSTGEYRRIYAIGDIHGYYAALVDLLDGVYADGYSGATDQLVFLGDYVDRGPDSLRVVDMIVRLQQGGAIALRGNHEQMMIDAYEAGMGSLERNDWWHQGGRATALSFSPTALAIPQSVITWAKALPLTASIGSYDFVHAGFRPVTNHILNTTDYDKLWIRDPFLDSTFDFGKIIVHGHTPVSTPVVRSNRIGIDTVIKTGWPTVVCLEQGKEPRFIRDKEAAFGGEEWEVTFDHRNESELPPYRK